LAEPAGSSGPKFASSSTTSGFATKSQTPLSLTCSAQGFPAPAFRYNVSWILIPVPLCSFQSQLVPQFPNFPPVPLAWWRPGLGSQAASPVQDRPLLFLLLGSKISESFIRFLTNAVYEVDWVSAFFSSREDFIEVECPHTKYIIAWK
jgi:hypothetical protein